MVKVDRREARRPGEETILIRLGKVVEAIIRSKVQEPTPLTTINNMRFNFHVGQCGLRDSSKVENPSQPGDPICQSGQVGLLFTICWSQY